MAFQRGTQIQPRLGAVDFSPVQRGAEVAGRQIMQGVRSQAEAQANAAAIQGQMFASIGQNVSEGIQKFAEKQKEKKRKEALKRALPEVLGTEIPEGALGDVIDSFGGTVPAVKALSGLIELRSMTQGRAQDIERQELIRTETNLADTFASQNVVRIGNKSYYDPLMASRFAANLQTGEARQRLDENINRANAVPVSEMEGLRDLTDAQRDVLETYQANTELANLLAEGEFGIALNYANRENVLGGQQDLLQMGGSGMNSEDFIANLSDSGRIEAITSPEEAQGRETFRSPSGNLYAINKPEIPENLSDDDFDALGRYQKFREKRLENLYGVSTSTEPTDVQREESTGAPREPEPEAVAKAEPSPPPAPTPPEEAASSAFNLADPVIQNYTQYLNAIEDGRPLSFLDTESNEIREIKPGTDVYKKIAEDPRSSYGKIGQENYTYVPSSVLEVAKKQTEEEGGEPENNEDILPKILQFLAPTSGMYMFRGRQGGGASGPPATQQPPNAPRYTGPRGGIDITPPSSRASGAQPPAAVRNFTNPRLGSQPGGIPGSLGSGPGGGGSPMGPLRLR